jgi:hypothetical protein
VDAWDVARALRRSSTRQNSVEIPSRPDYRSHAEEPSMASSSKFQIGFCQATLEHEHLFLSVTPGFEHGPGIERDGITEPRMLDPHCVPQVCNARSRPTDHPILHVTDPYIQRAGTWTIYHHLQHFIKSTEDRWQVVAIQSNGDLTMNPWHVAYIGASPLPMPRGLCALLTPGTTNTEPYSFRIYRCLVKWTDAFAKVRGGSQYEMLDLNITDAGNGSYAIRIQDASAAEACETSLGQMPGFNPDTKDVAPFIEFAVCGKPIIEKGVELPLVNAIDRFDDVRHIFNLIAKSWKLPTGSTLPRFEAEDNYLRYGRGRTPNEARRDRTGTSPVVLGSTVGGGEAEAVGADIGVRHTGYRRVGRSVCAQQIADPPAAGDRTGTRLSA